MARHSQFDLSSDSLNPGKKSSASKLSLFISLSSLVTVFLVIVVGWKMWRVTTVQCLIENLACPAEVSTLLDPLHNTPVFFYDHGSQVQDLLGQSQYQVSDIRKTGSGQLLVTLTAQTPAYQLMYQGQVFMVDPVGLLLPGDVTQTRIPVIDVQFEIGSLTISQPLDMAHHQLWQTVVLGVSKHHLPVQKIIARRPDLVVLKLDQGVQAFLDQDQTSEQLEKLKVILSQSSDVKTSEPVQEIDLRYKLPVLRTTKTEEM